MFFLAVVETLGLGSLSDKSRSLIAEIGRRATLCIANPQETMFLYQCISVITDTANVPRSKISRVLLELLLLVANWPRSEKAQYLY